MKQIIAFSGSNSSKSINGQLINHAATLHNNIEIIRLTDYEIPIYSFDIEEEEGFPEGVKQLQEKLLEANQLLIATPEHNGNLTAFFKNSLDWLSRRDRKFLEGKEVVILSTSPGKGGASSASKILENILPYFGATIKSTLSIGNFHKVFENGTLIDEDINNKLLEVLNSFT